MVGGISESLQIDIEFGLHGQVNSKNVLFFGGGVPLAESAREQKQEKYLQSGGSMQSLTHITKRKLLF